MYAREFWQAAMFNSDKNLAACFELIRNSILFYEKQFFAAYDESYTLS